MDIQHANGIFSLFNNAYKAIATVILIILAIASVGATSYRAWDRSGLALENVALVKNDLQKHVNESDAMFDRLSDSLSIVRMQNAMNHKVLNEKTDRTLDIVIKLAEKQGIVVAN